MEDPAHSWGCNQGKAFPSKLFQVMFPSNLGNVDLDDGGACEGYGAVGDGFDAEGNLVAVMEHDGVKPGGTFL